MITIDNNGFEVETAAKKATAQQGTASGILGNYSKAQPPPSPEKPKSWLVNPRSFIKGGINRGIPSYLLKDDEWFDSLNMVFDYDRAKILAARNTIGVLIPDNPYVFPVAAVDNSVCVANGAPVASSTSPFPGSIRGLLWCLPKTTTGPNEFADYCPLLTFSSTIVTQLPTADVYTATIRIRGVAEQTTYVGGIQTGYWLVGGSFDSTSLGFNIYKLVITSPTLATQTYFLNAGTSGGVGGDDLPDIFDYEQTVQLENGSIMMMSANSQDYEELHNPGYVAVDDNSAFPIQVPQPYDGQFMQLDVLSVSL